jgi:hypothetical protein
MSDDSGWFRRWMGEGSAVTALKTALEHETARVGELTAGLDEALQREAAQATAAAELNERLETLQTIIEACQDEQTRAAAHISTLENELSQARTQLADEHKKLLTASGHAATLQKRLTEAVDRDAERRHEHKALEDSLAGARQEQISLQQRAQELDRELEHQSEQLEALTLELAASEMARKQAETRAAALERRADDAEEAQRETLAEGARLTQQVAELEARLAEESQLKDTAIRGRGRATRELEEKTRELQEKAGELEEKTRELEVLEQRVTDQEALREDEARRHLAERAEWLELLQGLWAALHRTLGPVTSLALERSLRPRPAPLSRPGDGLGAHVAALSQWLGSRQLCRGLSARETSGGFELRLEPAVSPSATPGWLAPVIVHWLAQSMQTRYRAADVRWVDSVGTIAVERHPSA